MGFTVSVVSSLHTAEYIRDSLRLCGIPATRVPAQKMRAWVVRCPREYGAAADALFDGLGWRR